MMNFRWAAPCALAVSCGLMAAPVQAQSGLGFNSLELDFSYSGDTYPVTSVATSVDFAITGAHGLQFDLGLVDYDWGQMGHFATHLYMMPNANQKYGLFALYMDQDEEEFKEFAVGAEGLFDVSENFVLELRAGAGWLTENGVDYLFAEADGYYGISENLELNAGLTIINVEETDLNETSLSTRLGASYIVPDMGMRVRFGVEHSTASGKRKYKDDTAIFVGVTWQLGGTKSARRSATQRQFRTPDPMRAFRRRSAAFSWYER